MPRPTAAQLVYGSCTVILSTLAMLLLSGAGSAAGVAVVAAVALTLGLLVSLAVPARTPARPTRPAAVTRPSPAQQEPVAASVAADN
ncbi:hypothetical protein ACIQ6Y_38070 [Streptomyces sp. NPDC096205]|uniref:hypothetical protein n=1 Tax=Streptomyces sp. NPDC096205 TaxID=3366081 RepID=UPI003813792C